MEYEYDTCRTELDFEQFPAGSCFAPYTRKVDDPESIFDRIGHIALNDTVDAVFHCSEADENGMVEAIEVIIHNRENGKTCFFDANSKPSPRSGEPAIPVSAHFPGLDGPHSDPNLDGEFFWKMPQAAPTDTGASTDFPCTACHTGGGPYVIGPSSFEAMGTFGLINDGHDTLLQKIEFVRADERERQRSNDFLHSRALSPNCSNACHALRNNSIDIFGNRDNAFGGRRGIVETGLALFNMGIMPPHEDEASPYAWINYDSLDNGGDGEYFEQAKARFPVIQNCVAPTWMEAHAVNSDLVFSTARSFPDTLQTFNLKEGLVCINGEQDDGSCNEYALRYLCEVEVAGQLELEYQWTDWSSIDTAAGDQSTGDFERRADYTWLCENPVGLEARTQLGDGSYAQAIAPHDKLARFDASGLECLHQDQVNGQACHNYVVRYRGCLPEEPVVFINNVWSGQNLGITSQQDNAQVSTRPTDFYWQAHYWKLIPVAGTEYFRIHNQWSGKYLNVESNDDYSRVLTYALNSHWDSQIWELEAVANSNEYRIRNTWSGRYLTTTHSGGYAEVRAQELHLDWSSQRWVLDIRDL